MSAPHSWRTQVHTDLRPDEATKHNSMSLPRTRAMRVHCESADERGTDSTHRDHRLFSRTSQSKPSARCAKRRPRRAVIGVFGLVAYIVTMRTHEIGIRLALGATREKVFFELFRQGARLVFAGLIVGVAGAVALRKIASTFIFGVTTGDPLTYLFAAVTFSAVALTAVIFPARRASRIEPTSALRFE